MNRRIEALATLCPMDQPLLDVGSDHGLLIKLLLHRGFSSQLYASELTAASWQTLRHQLADLSVETYQADGLNHLPKEVKTVVIAGMGGQLIQDILDRHPDKLQQLETLVLGPQRDVATLRKWLMDHHWRIEEEALVYEANQGYPFLKVKHGNMTLNAIEQWYGPWLILHPTLDYLLWLSQQAHFLRHSLQLRADQTKQMRLDWIVNYVKNHDLA